MYKRSCQNALYGILYILIVFILTRQLPFSKFSFIANIAVFAYLLIFTYHGLKRHKIDTLVFYSYSSVLIFYSLINQNDIFLIIRFGIIILVLLLSYNACVHYKFLKYFFYLTLFQSVVVILFEIVLLIFFDKKTYLPIRHYILGNLWGDVYTYSSYYKVQIVGSVLLSVAYCLTYYKKVKQSFSRIVSLRIIYILGVFFAGNFAYLIGIFFFHVAYYLSKKTYSLKKRMLRLGGGVCLAILLSPFVITYYNNVMEKKDESMAVRQAQAELLINTLVESPITFFFGKGIGYTLNSSTSYREYSGHIYFELQWLYFWVQLGCIGFLIYIYFHIYLFAKFIRSLFLSLVYLTYLLYAVTNPYLFDTNHFIVIVTLSSLYKIEKNENRLRISSLQPN